MELFVGPPFGAQARLRLENVECLYRGNVREHLDPKVPSSFLDDLVWDCIRSQDLQCSRLVTWIPEKANRGYPGI